MNGNIAAMIESARPGMATARLPVRDNEPATNAPYQAGRTQTAPVASAAVPEVSSKQ